MNPFKYGCAVGGEYFCPRPDLVKRLRSYVESGQNVVMQGERRMGKTSLVLETVRSMKGVSLFHADLLCVRDGADLCRRLATALSRLDHSSGFLEKTLSSLARLRPTLTVDPDTGTPTLSVDAAAASAPDSLDAVLDAILARTARHRICVVLDEFQDILDIPDSRQTLAILRGRIQLDSATPYVFLGSIRNRMTDIFWHPDSPFYHSAAALPVGEIAKEGFRDFIRGRFATGARTLPDASFDSILSLARRTPGYVQELCDAIWDVTAQGDDIDAAAIRRALETLFGREQDHYEIFLRRLTALQLRVLRTLALRGGREIYSGAFLSAAAVYNAASVRRAVTRLEAEGLVYSHESEYRFVNPFFAEWIRRT